MDDSQEVEFQATLKIIAFILQESATQNELLARPTVTLSRFHTLVPPQIPILKYLQFLHEKAGVPRSCFIVALIYIDRLLVSQTNITITPNTIHKLFLTSILTASKFNTDIYYSNAAWAGFGGIRTEELNVLEREFLFLLQFSLVVTKQEYEKYDSLIREKMSYEAFQDNS